MTDKATKRLERHHAELQRIKDAKQRWLKKLIRAANALDKLNKEELRLLKPRKLEPHEKQDNDEMKHRWHKIRENKILNDLDDIAELNLDL